MELILIRHALPLRVENADGTPADPPLSEIGEKQAAQLAHWLGPEGFDALYVSPLRRARATAAPLELARGLRATVEPGITELDADSEFYIPLEELKATDYDRWLEAVQGGLEAAIDIDAFRRTVVAALERIVERHPGERVAAVCHGGVINAWAAHVVRIAEPLFFQPDYTSVNRFLAAGSGERSVVSLNETGHLR